MGHKLDQQLISEAYNFAIAKSDIINTPINILSEAIENNRLSYAQTEAVIVVAEGIMSGLKSLGGAAVQGVAGAYDKAKQGAQAAGSALKAGAGQVGSNIKNIYQTASAAGDAANLDKQATNLISKLTALLGKLREFQGKPVGGLTLDVIAKAVNDNIQASADRSAAARQNGITGGIGKAMGTALIA